MAKKFLTNLDMTGNAILNPVFNPLATAPEHAPAYYCYVSTAQADLGIMYVNIGTYESPVWQACGRAPIAGDGIVVDGYEISLPETFYDYLVEATFKQPVITAFSITGLGGAAEIGTSVSVSGFNHTETNVNNINGKLTLKYDGSTIDSNITPSAASATGTFTEQIVTMSSAGSKSFILSGTDALGHSISKTVSKTFYIPKFIGSNSKTSVTASDILVMSKGQSQPSSITLAGSAYIYFVTNGTINTVKDAATGFGVPLESPVTTSVSINGVNVSYKVYRTSNMIVAGSYSFQIS